MARPRSRFQELGKRRPVTVSGCCHGRSIIRTTANSSWATVTTTTWPKPNGSVALLRPKLCRGVYCRAMGCGFGTSSNAAIAVAAEQLLPVPCRSRNEDGPRLRRRSCQVSGESGCSRSRRCHRAQGCTRRWSMAYAAASGNLSGRRSDDEPIHSDRHEIASAPGTSRPVRTAPGPDTARVIGSG